jgi:hypothetical protein
MLQLWQIQTFRESLAQRHHQYLQFYDISIGNPLPPLVVKKSITPSLLEAAEQEATDYMKLLVTMANTQTTHAEIRYCS